MAEKDLKKSMTIREASDFWEEHEFGEFEDVQEVHDVQFKLRKKKYIGLDPDLYEIIRLKAAALKTSEEDVIRECVLRGRGA
ncbi:MAG: hypothetical protein U5R49_27100 [Deltaproteobacteria bacterium]|nr:hypothetical protein [Deltaproteobacteria bacterium]